MKSLLLSLILICVSLFIACSEYPPVVDEEPYIEIINPKPNTNVPDSTTIKVSTNLDNLVRVELYIDHYIPGEEAIFKKPPYEYLWYTSYYQDGSQHILQAKAYDYKGNSFDSKFVIVNVYRFRPSSLLAFLKADSLI